MIFKSSRAYSLQSTNVYYLHSIKTAAKLSPKPPVSQWALPRSDPAAPGRSNPCFSFAGCQGNAESECTYKDSSKQIGKYLLLGQNKMQRTSHNSSYGLGSGSSRHFWAAVFAWKI